MRFRLFIIRLLSLVAIGVSTAQLADHLTGADAFCGFDDCQRVTGSAYGEVLGIPLSAIGLVGFAVVYGLTLTPGRRLQQILQGCTFAAAFVGVALMLIQFFVLHAVCKLCLVVDISAIALAVAGSGKLPEPLQKSRFVLLGWLIAPAAVALIPVCWTAAVMPEPVPAIVQEQWAPGRITIVDVADFECPHCKKADAMLRDVAQRHGARLVRLVCPMPSHMTGENAAKAFIAARRLGKGDEMAAELFADEDHRPEHCRELAERLRLDLKEYDRLVQDGETFDEYKRTLNWVKAANLKVPVAWVQDRMIEGTPTLEKVEAALRSVKPAD